MEDLNEYRKNILKILDFAIKDNFSYLNQIKNIEITIAVLIKKIKSSVTDEVFFNQLKKTEIELGSYSFASLSNKQQLLMSIYDLLKDKDLNEVKQNEAAKYSKNNLKIFFKPVSELSFVSEKDKLVLNEKGIVSVLDLLYSIPKKYENFTEIRTFNKDYEGKEVQLLGVIYSKRYVDGKRRYMEIVIKTQTGNFKVILFNYKVVGFLFKVGEQYLLRGILNNNSFFGFHMVHPHAILVKDETTLKQSLITHIKYTDYGVLNEVFHGYIKTILETYKNELVDFVPFQFLKENKFVSFYDNMTALHNPDPKFIDFAELNTQKSIYHQRLKFEEFFLLHLVHLMKKENTRNKKGIVVPINFKLHQEFIKTLSFELTQDQLKAISDLFEDMRNHYSSNRLIQGDVGSGKTVVVVSSMLQAVKAGYQAIIMVPTEILARQHYLTISKMMKSFDISVQLLISKMKKSNKDTILQQLEEGVPQIYVGTHALIQKQIKYKNPAIVIIDEQHRFGVLQRKTLQEIAQGVNVILLSATPIPRTLSMGLFGDLDITYIETMPKSRKPIKTIALTEEQIGIVVKLIIQEVVKGRQAYIIFPIIEESETLNINSLMIKYQEYSEKYFADFNCGLLHGKMKPEEKDEVMQDFGDGKINILFATTVVEVGIDVPNATVMVVMNGERFGLSQLHQLRGRVGRGEFDSYCFLISPKDDVKRLHILEGSINGFQIAREDLKLRGPGDIYGVDQSGLPKFRFVDFDEDEDIILTAGQSADRYLKYDPSLSKNKILKDFLALLKENSYWEVS